MQIKPLLVLLILFISTFSFSQNDYRPEKERVHDLVHTKLNVSFDVYNSFLLGEAWVTLTPHFKATNKVTLDAKSMLVHDVQMNNRKLTFDYVDSEKLIVELDREYSKGEEFKVFIKYTARPELVPGESGGKNIDHKGLYFIDPRNENPTKPMQIWTEGEPESNSVWFPTLDSPNQKSSQEISITVPNKYVTLSNGLLVSQTNNKDGSRTDYWKQDLKHAPYLFFIGVGEFSVIKDIWKGKPIEYYVEREYEEVARSIFGKTPEMLSFYEDLLGVEYPWDKYSQIVVRDYISGAMENTTAVVHSDSAYQEEGELVDENKWERTIAHEAFHHWFGDMVTAESWSNLTLNEAFANYGEYLWFKHAYGKDIADEARLKSQEWYFNGGDKNQEKDLVRFQYNSVDDLFDNVSYEKGGAVLHMLRKYLGDEQFFLGLKKYIQDNEFSSVEAHHLRLALEEVSGKDLNWFFNQWFFSNSHPKLIVEQYVGGFNDVVNINVRQTENIFQFPLTIDVYEEDGVKTTHNVWVGNRDQRFTFKVKSKPKLVVVDPFKDILAHITKKPLTLEEAIFQYKHADSFWAKKEALIVVAENQDKLNAFNTMVLALDDTSHHLRIFAINKLDLIKRYSKENAIKKIENISNNDSYTLVKAAANTTLAKLVDPRYKVHFMNALKSDSYKVVESAVIGLYHLNKEDALVIADGLPEKVKDDMGALLTSYYISSKDEKHMNFISKHVIDGLFFVQKKEKADTYMSAFEWISKSNNAEAISNLVNGFVEIGIKYKRQGGDSTAIHFLRQMQHLQRESSNPNKNELVGIIREGMSKLLS